MPTLYNVFHLPDIGFGTFPQKEELRESLPIAIHCGFRLVDFSDNYLNESYAQEGIDSSGDDSVIIVTKFSQPLRTFALKTCVEESRQNWAEKPTFTCCIGPFHSSGSRHGRQIEDLHLSRPMRT